MIIAKTPLRLSFFGGGTDYPNWIAQHGGQVLSTSIDKYNYITCRYLPPFFDHKYRLSYSKLEHVSAFDDIQHPSIKACLSYLNISEGIEMHYDADLPARTGLGTSSAFTVGCLNALSTLLKCCETPQDLAKKAIHVEQTIIGETVGSQDQFNAAFGGFNHIIFHADGTVDVTPVSLSKERKSELENNLLLFFTGTVRTASDIAKDQVKNTKKNESTLHKMNDLVNDALSILTGDGNLDDFGALLDNTWRYKRGLSDKVSTPHIDSLYEKAVKAGALGGKLLGAGGGGFMLFYVSSENQARVKESLSDLLYVPFEFDNTGSQIIFNQHNEKIN